MSDKLNNFSSLAKRLKPLTTIKNIALCLWMSLIVLAASATHIVGGEIYYKCLGNGQYEVTLRVYRDCYGGQAGFDRPAYVAVYDTSGLYQVFNFSPPQVNNIPIKIDNPCLVAPPNVCVEEGVYTEVITLPANRGAYTLVYQRCCRNNTIQNLFNPGDQGATYTVEIPDVNAIGTCNSSPSFNDFPPVAICANEPLNFNHSATDSDGDSLVYKLCAPFRGASRNTPMPTTPSAPPFTKVVFASGYSATDPLAASPKLQIDPATGIITGTPVLVGQYVVGVCVEEYRNGVLINTLRRDFQFNVADCDKTTEAIIPTAQQDDYIANCENLNITFGNQSYGASRYLWDFGVPGVQYDTSNQQYPTFTFPDTGTYNVMLIANPRSTCSDTDFVEVRLYPFLNAAFSWEGSCPGTPIAFTNLSNSTYSPITRYFWSFGNGSTAIDTNPVIQYNTSGRYPVSLTVYNAAGCQMSTYDTLTVFPEPQAGFTGDNPCIFAPMALTNTSQISVGTIAQYAWSIPPDSPFAYTRDASYTFDQPSSGQIQLVVTSDQGCRDTATLPYTVRAKPVAEASGDTIVCPGEPVALSAAGGSTFSWGPFGASIDDPSAANTIAYPAEATTYIATVSDDCYFDTAHVNVEVYPVPTLTARRDTAIMAGSPVRLTATSDAGNVFTWSPATFLDNPFGTKPVATPTQNMIYTVAIANDYGCQSLDEVKIWVTPVCNQLYVPEAFTPNGDGKNDRFMAIDYGQNQMQSLQIYNRYGQLVFEGNSFEEGWDGTFRGQPQPIGTYAYLLRVYCNNADRLISGNVTLLR